MRRRTRVLGPRSLNHRARRHGDHRARWQLVVQPCGFSLTVTCLSRVATISNGASPIRSPTLTTTTYLPSPSSSDGEAVLSVVIGTRLPSLSLATRSMLQTAPFFTVLPLSSTAVKVAFPA